MGFWNKLGKIALQAAPYVAAPFTGGASLYAVPATQKLGQKWAESDAKKAAEKGLAPSKFDKYLGMASNVASLASGTGALGKLGSAAYSGANAAGAAGKVSQLSGWQNKLKQGGQIASMMSGGSPYAGAANYTGAPPENEGMGWQGQLAGLLSQNQGQNTEEAPVQSNVAAPRAYNPIEAGRQIAMQNQPFRSGYTVTSPGPEEGQTTTNQMPPIYPQYGDALTPIQNYARRRRNPQMETVQ